MTPKQTAELYPLALLDVSKKAKETSSKPIILEFHCPACVDCTSIRVKCTSINIKYHCPDSKRCPAVWALVSHRTHVRDALIALFETPVPASNGVGRKVLTRVLCSKEINFDKPILDFTTNRHLEAMAKQHDGGMIPAVWETKKRKESNAKTVLDSIKNDGQQILAGFQGNVPHPYLCSDVQNVCADAALLQGKSLWLMNRGSSTPHSSPTR
jgi:hypothetical protein